MKLIKCIGQKVYLLFQPTIVALVYCITNILQVLTQIELNMTKRSYPIKRIMTIIHYFYFNSLIICAKCAIYWLFSQSCRPVLPTESG